MKMDPYTMDNTVLKMAKKRALVDAALLVASLSDVFTQDLEDMDINGRPIDTQKVYTDQDSTISKAQAKRMFALAKGNPDIVRRVLDDYGYEKSSEVEKVKYDEVCKEIELMTQKLEQAQGDGAQTQIDGN